MNYSALQWTGLLAVPLMIAIGQILFKVTSGSISDQSGLLASVATSFAFWVAMILYGAATLAWIPVIRNIPISQAYVFMALTYLYVPIFSLVLLKEEVTPATLIGGVVIVVGILITAWR